MRMSTISRSPLRVSQSGMTIMLVIAFLGVLSLLLAAITGYVFQQARYGRALYARERALQVAEAGLEYYRWFLAKNPSIMETGVGLESPYTYSVVDPEGGSVGDATITAAATLSCGAVQYLDLESEGIPDISPTFTRRLFARYMRPSVAQYSYIVGENVWAGSDRTIVGPYHSNGGIRMDGTNNSTVGSAVSTWNCTSSYNCSPSQPNAPGVLGSGSGFALWQYPVSSIDFASIAVDLADVRTYVQNGGGLYYGPASGSENSRGYHLVFNAGGTVTIYRVTSTIGVRGYSTQTNWQTEYNIINNETLLGTYTIPSSCAVIFIEDRVWLEGTVDGKVTVIAATPTTGSTYPDVLLRGNILYASEDGSDGLTVIAERNILLPLTTPENMEIHGIFVAQSGRYGRNHYVTSGSNQVPSQYDSYVLQNTLTTVGTVVSAQRTGTAWSSGGSTVSGYQNRNDYYDRVLAFSPPPFTPTVSPDYTFALWREE